MKSIFGKAIIFMVATLSAVALILGCNLNPSVDQSRVTYPNETLSLVDINDASAYSTTTKALKGGTERKKLEVPGGATITLVAEVSPPTSAAGDTLQASHIYLSSDGETAFVAYMLQHEKVSGGLDVFDISIPRHPQLKYSQLFPDFDIAVVQADANTVFLAGQKIDESGEGKSAYILRIPYSKRGGLDMSETLEKHLPGYFATDLYLTESALYVTTGTASTTQPNVGLFVLDPDTLEVVAQKTSDYPDLRSVAVHSSNVAVFEAATSSPTTTNARVDIYKNDDFSDSTKPTSIDLSAYPPDAGAKAKMEYYSDKTIFVATNSHGVVILDADKGTIQGRVPAPALAFVKLADQTSNAVSSGNTGKKDLIYIANGEAGLWVGDASALEEQTTTNSTWNIAGTIRFNARESVNYVASKKSTVICASGLGGIKILDISAK